MVLTPKANPMLLMKGSASNSFCALVLSGLAIAASGIVVSPRASPKKVPVIPIVTKIFPGGSLSVCNLNTVFRIFLRSPEWILSSPKDSSDNSL